MKIYHIFIIAIVLLISSCNNTVELYNYINFDDIRAKINASSNGSVVDIPAGMCIIDSQIVITKNITLRGAGIDKTFIVSVAKDYDEQPILVDTSENGTLLRITAMSFKSFLKSSNANFIKVAGSCKRLRIDHCKFTDGGAHSIMIDGDVAGVIDHCEFTNDSQESISIRNTDNQNAIWTAGLDMPAPDTEAVFMEYNNFNFITTGTHAVTAVNGARFVFRYNTVISNIPGALVDAHGNFENDRSNYSAEVYNNHLENTNNSTYISYAVYIRGGRAVICDNDIFGLISYPIVFTNYRSWTSSSSWPSSGSVTVDGVTYRPNLALVDDAQSASDAVNRSYCWGNTLDGRMRSTQNMQDSTTTQVNGAVVNAVVLRRGYDTDHIVLNTDYYNSSKSGYAKDTYHSLDY